MISERILRAASVALALVALVDPACRTERTQPIAVRVHAASATPADQSLADRVDKRLRAALGGRADLDSPNDPEAVVIAGEPVDWPSVPDGIPISIVTDAGPDARNVRLVDVAAPQRMFTGIPAPVAVVVSGKGMAGQSTRVALHLDGVEIDSVAHQWTRADETFDARLEYLPPFAGSRQLRVSASLGEGEATDSDNRADLGITVDARKLRVLVHEPRPSWQATFVRRALEGDPLFEVSGLARTSRGIEVRTGEPPERLVAANLERFDAIVVGAPEELQESDVTALEWFLRTRGGAVVFVPDRRPSGPYLRMIPAASFQEVLIDSATVLRSDAGNLRGSEFAVAEKLAPSAEVLAGLARSNGTSPVVVTWPEGLGRAIFSGALDAWRHRGRSEEFSTFWRGRVMTAAAQSPSALEVATAPIIVQPGERVQVLARLRPTEFARGPRASVLPEMSGSVALGNGESLPLRLWPTAEAGTYEGQFDAPAPGRYEVEVTGGERLSARAEVIAAAGARSGHLRSAAIDLIARASGGIVADASDLSAVESQLRALPQRTRAETTWPARSRFWVAAFAMLLGAEWFLRRRRGFS